METMSYRSKRPGKYGEQDDSPGDLQKVVHSSMRRHSGAHRESNSLPSQSSFTPPTHETGLYVAPLPLGSLDEGVSAAQQPADNEDGVQVEGSISESSQGVSNSGSHPSSFVPPTHEQGLSPISQLREGSSSDQQLDESSCSTDQVTNSYAYQSNPDTQAKQWTRPNFDDVSNLSDSYSGSEDEEIQKFDAKMANIEEGAETCVYPDSQALSPQEVSNNDSSYKDSACDSSIYDNEAGYTSSESSFEPDHQPFQQTKTKRRRMVFVALTAFLLTGGAVAAALIFTSRDNDQSSNNVETPPSTEAPTDATSHTTLERIVESNVLRCGVSDRLRFGSASDNSVKSEGFEIDLCRAVAAAILGDPDLVEIVVVDYDDEYVTLQNETIDLLAKANTITMERDVHETTAQAGFSFSIPVLYDGLMFGGVPPFASCAETLETANQCAGLMICAKDRSIHSNFLKTILPDQNLFLTNATYSPLQGFLDKNCNVIAGDSFDVAWATVRSVEYSGTYEMGSKMLVKEPKAISTRDDDPQFSDFCNWVFQALIIAEAKEVTQATASSFGKTDLFGSQFQNMFVNAISAIGNYAELYERHLGDVVFRHGMNLLNSEGDTGLIQSLPFGNLQSSGPGPVINGTLQDILNRGHLICGISQREGFGGLNSTTGQWSGAGADYCRALAAAIFNGDVKTAKIVVVESDAFVQLSSAEVDVLASVEIALATDVLEANSGQGFSFSQPYFYDPVDAGDGANTFGAALALATRESDPQWSSFVYWIVGAMFYAEENNITQQTSDDMPLIQFFGPTQTKAFRHAITVSGNYGEIYQRNIEAFFPRSGRNLLNSDGPQHFPVAGL